jgi:imidazolonepropionase-like amidohydrolase
MPSAAVLLAAAVATAPQGVEPVAFTDVTVVSLESDRVLPGQVVVVEGGRIASLGPADRVRIPRTLRRIDGRGRFLMPGLVDTHIHIWPEESDAASAEKEFLLLLAHGVTTARVMIGQPEHLRLREQIARGELLGPTLYVAGPPLGVAPGEIPGAPELKTPEDAARAVAAQKQAGYDAVKVLDGLGRAEYDAAVKEAREAGLPVVGHVPGEVGLEHALASRQDSIDHLSGYLEALIRDDSPLKGQKALRLRDVIPALDESKMGPLARATRAAGVANVPTLFFWRALFSLDTPEDLRKRPGLEFVPARKIEEWSEQRRKMLANATSTRATMARYHALRDRLTKALGDAGARVLLGTDSPDFFNVPGVAALEELKLLVGAGLTPCQTLRAGTADAAAFLGGAEEFGTVAVGRRADLILLEANPLQDVRNVARRAGVMVRGRWLPEAELQAKLKELAAQVRGGSD